MRSILSLLTTAVLVLGFTVRAGAFASDATQFAGVKAAHPLPADPAQADPAWAAGRVDLKGGFENLTTRAAAGHTTTVSLEYDDRYLYVGFHCEQAGTPIVATQTTNDVGFGLDDFVGIGIDTSGNGSQSYFFEATPRGVRYEQASENARYRPAWIATGSIHGGAWDAVLIIPLDALRIHTGSPQTWRINFLRNLAAVGEHYTWAYNGIMQDGPVGNAWPQFADARFWPAWEGLTLGGRGKAARPKPRAEIYGLESAGFDRSQFAQADGSFRYQTVRTAGVDLSVPLTNTINFVGTLSPDFSNVEIDQQTIAPQEFRRNLQEYRPFFSQGATFINANSVPLGGFLGPQNSVFYSPGVGPFDRGEKIEGTFGRQSFGVLNFRGYDQTTGNTFDDTAYGYKHSLPDRTFLYWADGVLAHHSSFGDDATTEFGVGGRNNKTGLVYGVDHAIERGSWVPQGVAASSNGFVDVHKPNYEVNLGYADLSPNYNPLDGFTTNSDIRGFGGYVNFVGTTPQVKNYTLFMTADRYLDRSGAVHQADAGAFFNATFKNGFSINGAGPTISELRSYSILDPAGAHTTCADPALPRTFFTGFPSYFCGRDVAFNLMAIPVGYRDGTPTPIDASVNYGRFGDNNLHLYTLSTSRPIGRILSLGLEYDGSYERSLATGALDSQWLRRVSIGAQLGADTNLTLSLRSVNGLGGFVPRPGTNVAFAFHRRFVNGNELFVNFGTPASYTTLDRVIAKYIFHFGGDTGT
ncbi:MAG TPA: hypothetical protein VIG32_02480 [Candidatus Baltobacteraceae bacterium]|jgi:hypothetical protein